MLKVSQDFTVAPYYITFIVYITEPTLFYGWNEEMIWKVSLGFYYLSYLPLNMHNHYYVETEI
jgi:hypothetical protein